MLHLVVGTKAIRSELKINAVFLLNSGIEQNTKFQIEQADKSSFILEFSFGRENLTSL